VAGTTVYQELAEARDRKRYPAPGRMVDVGGRQLHFEMTGSGTPTVVVETGAGTLARTWAPLVQRIAHETTVVTYDRAGYGWSDGAGWGRRTGADVADDLITLLEEANIPGPYVLVGHSLGALYARAFAARAAESTAGLVLVDGTHEDVMEHLRARLGAKGVAAQVANLFLITGIPRGLVRLGIRAGVLGRWARSMMGSESDEEFALHTALYLTGRFRWASLGETLGIPATAAYLRDHRHLGDLPIVVVTAADPPADAPLAEFRDTWLELQADLATLSTNAMQVVATKGGHFVYKDDPDIVYEAIERVVHAGRGGA